MQRGKTFQDPSISNFIFVITPTEAHFSRTTKNKRTLTLEKGMQTLGTLQQCIPLIIKDSKRQHKHKFNSEEHIVTFRVINDKNLNYQWTVYKVLDGGELEEIDSMAFSILSFWKSYIGEYQKNVANLLQRTKDEKESKKTLEIWKEILFESKQRSDNLRVVFAKSDFRLDFKIEARSVLDKQLQEYETEKVMKKLRQAEKSQLRKSAITLSNIGQDDFTSDQIRIIEKIRRGKTEEGERLNPNMLSPSSRNYLLPIKERNESLKKIHSHNETSIHRARFNEEAPQSLEISSDSKNSVKRANSLQRHQSLKDLDRQQNLQLSSKIKHQKAKYLQVAKKQQSPISSIKVIVVYLIVGGVMFWLMYNLMGPHSKVKYRK